MASYIIITLVLRIGKNILMGFISTWVTFRYNSKRRGNSIRCLSTVDNTGYSIGVWYAMIRWADYDYRKDNYADIMEHERHTYIEIRHI